jgi:hypothetical protein
VQNRSILVQEQTGKRLSNTSGASKFGEDRDFQTKDLIRRRILAQTGVSRGGWLALYGGPLETYYGSPEKNFIQTKN